MHAVDAMRGQPHHFGAGLEGAFADRLLLSNGAAAGAVPGAAPPGAPWQDGGWGSGGWGAPEGGGRPAPPPPLLGQPQHPVPPSGARRSMPGTPLGSSHTIATMATGSIPATPGASPTRLRSAAASPGLAALGLRAAGPHAAQAQALLPVSTPAGWPHASMLAAQAPAQLGGDPAGAYDALGAAAASSGWPSAPVNPGAGWGAARPAGAAPAHATWPSATQHAYLQQQMAKHQHLEAQRAQLLALLGRAPGPGAAPVSAPPLLQQQQQQQQHQVPLGWPAALPTASQYHAMLGATSAGFPLVAVSSPATPAAADERRGQLPPVGATGLTWHPSLAPGGQLQAELGFAWSPNKPPLRRQSASGQQQQQQQLAQAAAQTWAGAQATGGAPTGMRGMQTYDAWGQQQPPPTGPAAQQSPDGWGPADRVQPAPAGEAWPAMEPALAREPQQAQQATWPAVDGWGRRVQADAAAGCGDSGWGAAAAEASAAGQLGGGWQAAVDVAGGAAGGCWGAAAVPSAGGWGAAHGQQGNVYDEGCVQGSWPALQACAQGWPASSGWESAGVRAAPGARQPGAWPAQQQATPGAATAAAVVAAHEAALGAGQLEAAPAPAWPAAGEAQGQPPSDLLLLQQAQQAQPVNMARQGQAFFMATDVHVVDRFWESLAPALQRLEVLPLPSTYEALSDQLPLALRVLPDPGGLAVLGAADVDVEAAEWPGSSLLGSCSSSSTVYGGLGGGAADEGGWSTRPWGGGWSLGGAAEEGGWPAPARPCGGGVTSSAAHFHCTACCLDCGTQEELTQHLDQQHRAQPAGWGSGAGGGSGGGPAAGERAGGWGGAPQAVGAAAGGGVPKAPAGRGKGRRQGRRPHQ